jgi:hypothetical protein
MPYSGRLIGAVPNIPIVGQRLAQRSVDPQIYRQRNVIVR